MILTCLATDKTPRNIILVNAYHLPVVTRIVFVSPHTTWSNILRKGQDTDPDSPRPGSVVDFESRSDGREDHEPDVPSPSGNLGVELGKSTSSSVLKPDVVILVETAKPTEPDILIILGNYNSRAYIFVGDHQQLKPFVISDNASNNVICWLFCSSPVCDSFVMRRSCLKSSFG